MRTNIVQQFDSIQNIVEIVANKFNFKSKYVQIESAHKGGACTQNYLNVFFSGDSLLAYYKSC